MEPERTIARVPGLGRGNIVGFSLILTDQKIVGIDTRKFTARVWLTAILGLSVGIILVVAVLFSGLEPALFKVNPLLSFVVILLIVFLLPIGTFLLVPRFLRTRLGRIGSPRLQALKKDIVSIEIRNPGKITEKGYFTVSLLNGTSFTFWTLGQEMFDQVNSLLNNYAPAQINNLDSDSYNNRLPAIIVVSGSIILFVIVGGVILSSYFTFFELVDYITGVVVIHALGLFGYRSLRRLRHRRR